MNAALEQLVWHRAEATCEYCRMTQAIHPIPFQVDHIIARQHGGPTRADNLALACVFCNGYKGPNLCGINHETRRLVRLYHPRRDRWAKHFAWAGPVLAGLTANGRATVAVLAINHPARVAARAVLIDGGVFPL